VLCQQRGDFTGTTEDNKAWRWEVRDEPAQGPQ